jgi:protein SCO1
MHRRTIIFLCALAASSASCARDVRATGESEYRGVELARPIPRPDFTLASVRGDTFDFLAETRGTVTLLFFGYTHCPDVCPVHMANIAAVKRRLSYDQRRLLQVVFVTTDPDRDTPEHLESWLSSFDPEFIGLTGAAAEVNAIESRLGLPASVPGAASAGGRYEVGHASQVIAFTRDDSAHVVYPFGTRQSDWAHDLPRLLDERWRRPSAGGPPPPAETHGH